MASAGSAVVQVSSGFLKGANVSPRERQPRFVLSSLRFWLFSKPSRLVWATLFALRPSNFVTAAVAEPRVIGCARVEGSRACFRFFAAPRGFSQPSLRSAAQSRPYVFTTADFALTFSSAI